MLFKNCEYFRPLFGRTAIVGFRLARGQITAARAVDSHVALDEFNPSKMASG
jgi:hypothetical protein